MLQESEASDFYEREVCCPNESSEQSHELKIGFFPYSIYDTFFPISVKFSRSLYVKREGETDYFYFRQMRIQLIAHARFFFITSSRDSAQYAHAYWALNKNIGGFIFSHFS